MSEWPNHDGWGALSEGEHIVEGNLYRLQVVDCGDLFLPSGRLVACDPFAAMSKRGNPFVSVPPGRYPVRVTIADISDEGDGSHLREAYASLILSQGAEVRREPLTPLPEGAPAPTLEPGDYIGFPVDAGTACFVDDRAVEHGMPPTQDWYRGLFENDQPDCWFARMDDPGHIRAGIANIPLPLAQDGSNLILFHSGWGDGFYPVIGGYDAQGNLLAVHIDFFVLSDPQDEDEDEDEDE